MQEAAEVEQSAAESLRLLQQALAPLPLPSRLLTKLTVAPSFAPPPPPRHDPAHSLISHSPDVLCERLRVRARVRRFLCVCAHAAVCLRVLTRSWIVHVPMRCCSCAMRETTSQGAALRETVARQRAVRKGMRISANEGARLR